MNQVKDANIRSLLRLDYFSLFFEFLDSNTKTIDNYSFLGYTNLKNEEVWYDYGHSAQRIFR